MIEVVVDGHVFTYYGKITIDTDDEPFITITSNGHAPVNDEQLLMWSSFTIDKFFLEDVQSIRGT